MQRDGTVAKRIQETCGEDSKLKLKIVMLFVGLDLGPKAMPSAMRRRSKFGERLKTSHMKGNFKGKKVDRGRTAATLKSTAKDR